MSLLRRTALPVTLAVGATLAGCGEKPLTEQQSATISRLQARSTENRAFYSGDLKKIFVVYSIAHDNQRVFPEICLTHSAIEAGEEMSGLKSRSCDRFGPGSRTDRSEELYLSSAPSGNDIPVVKEKLQEALDAYKKNYTGKDPVRRFPYQVETAVLVEDGDAGTKTAYIPEFNLVCAVGYFLRDNSVFRDGKHKEADEYDRQFKDGSPRFVSSFYTTMQCRDAYTSGNFAYKLRMDHLKAEMK